MSRAGQREVVVLGGGPGGSTVAGCLALLGRDVLLLERERFPRFHIGESLLPRSREILQKLGVEEQLEATFIRKYGARFVCATSGRQNHFRFAEAFDAQYDYAYEVLRESFDHVLLDNAARLGAEVRQRWEATEIVFEGSRAVAVKARPVDGGPEELIECKVVVDCTGRDSMVASRKRDKTKVFGLDKTALFGHYEGARRLSGHEAGDIQIVVFDEGWFWHIPLKGELTSFGAVLSKKAFRGKREGESLDAFFDRVIEEVPAAQAVLGPGRRVRPVRAQAEFSYRVNELAGDGWLLGGDAAGFLDPLFSTGAHLALKGGDLAATAIDRALKSGDTSRAAFVDYEVRVRKAVDLFMGVVQHFYAGTFREMLFQQNPRVALRRLITTMLSGDVFHDEPPPRWVGFVRAQYAPMLGPPRELTPQPVAEGIT